MEPDKYLVVESLEGRTVAKVKPKDSGRYQISTRRRAIRDLLEGLIADAEIQPIPILFGNRKVRTTRGQVNRSVGSYYKPGDEDFLDALADMLTKYEFYAYTEELVPS